MQNRLAKPYDKSLSHPAALRSVGLISRGRTRIVYSRGGGGAAFRVKSQQGVLRFFSMIAPPSTALIRQPGYSLGSLDALQLVTKRQWTVVVRCEEPGRAVRRVESVFPPE